MENSVKKFLIVFVIYLGVCLLLIGTKIFHPDELFFQAVRDPNPWFISYPWRNFVRLSFLAREFPLWNPYNILGEPFIANYQQAVFSPFRWLFYFLPFKLVVSPMIVLELVFAGLGVWLFAKRLKLGDFSAFVCGAGYMLSGYLVQYMNNQHLPIDMLLPYGLVMMDRLLEHRSFRNFSLLALIFILILVAGQPESALFNLGFIFLYYFFKSLNEKKFWTNAPVVFGVSGVAFMIFLIQFLPFLEAIPQSWTFHPPSTGSQHLALFSFASIISPGLFGRTDMAPIPLQQIFPWIGIVICFLALVAIINSFRKNSLAQNWQKHILFFALLALAGLGIAYGLPGFSALTHLPGLNLLVWLKYLQPVISISIILLAGIGLEQMRTIGSQLKIFPALILAMLILFSGFAYSFFSFPDLQNWTVFSFVFSFSLLLFAALITRFSRVWALIPLVILEPVVYHKALDRASFWINMEKTDLSRFRELQALYPEARFSASPDVWIPFMMLTVPLYDLGLNDALIPKRFVQLSNYLNEQRSNEELLNDYLAYHSLRFKESAFNFSVSKILGAKFFIRKSAPEKFEEWVKEPGFWIPGKDGLISHYTHTALYGDPIYVIPVPDSLPRVFFPEKLFKSPDELSSFQKTISLSDFEKNAVVEDYSGILPEFAGKPKRAEWRLGFSRVVLEYESEEDVFAVFSEQYFPGWRAYLDKNADKGVRAPGKELRIYPTDYLLRGVLAPAGAHRLEMIYEPWGFRVGLYASLGSLIIFMIVFMSRGFLYALAPRTPARSSS